MNISKIILNKDGSIKSLVLPYYIQQGNNGVDELQIGVDGLDTENTAIANFLRPNGTITSLAGVQKEISDDDGTTYNGFSFVLTQAETLYDGELNVSISIRDLNNNVLYSYAQTLTINKSVVDPDTETITLAQYNSIIQALNSYQQRFSARNVRAYDSLSDANNDLNNLSTNQYVLVKENGYFNVYVKNGQLLKVPYISDFADKDSNGNKIVSSYGATLKIVQKPTESDMYNTITLVSKDGKTLSNIRLDIPANNGSGLGGLLSRDDRKKYESYENKITSALKESKEYTDSKLNATYRYKGTVQTYNDLPTENNEIGDTYNVVEPYGDYPGGTNFAWAGSVWDALGGNWDVNFMSDAEIHEITGVN